MAEYSTNVRDDVATARFAAIGAAPELRIYSGSRPANYAAAATGTLLASMTLPTTWISTPSSGVCTLVGSWSDPDCNAIGTAGYYRIIGPTGGMQGPVSLSGGGGELILTNVSLAPGIAVSVTAFTHTEGGA